MDRYPAIYNSALTSYLDIVPSHADECEKIILLYFSLQW
jgi:hypothetical protein